MGVIDLAMPGRRASAGGHATAFDQVPEPVRIVLNWGRRYSLIRLGVIPFAPGPRQADLMIGSGTVTDRMVPAIERLPEQLPEPTYVIFFGACSNSGGPYRDSYCVTKGVDQLIPVDVPGCPPRPEAPLRGIRQLQAKIAGEPLGGVLRPEAGS